MSSLCKINEKSITNIIPKNVNLANEEDAEVNLAIYYKRVKTYQLLIRNNSKQGTPSYQNSRLVNQYSYKKENCATLKTTSIWMTTTKHSRHLILYHYDYAIRRKHYGSALRISQSS